MKNLSRYFVILITLFFSLSVFSYSITDINTDSLSSIPVEKDEKEDKPDAKESKKKKKNAENDAKKASNKDSKTAKDSENQGPDSKKEKELGKFYPKGF
ncbi:MAG: hypothetical protein H7A23_04380 [Leptospiraceae bacterium]|nr:hypothetical protein [Leptospiraceae bacterium]MCP5493770.1 hypothetical protein [Leptospiraceae bacterium]